MLAQKLKKLSVVSAGEIYTRCADTFYQRMEACLYSPQGRTICKTPFSFSPFFDKNRRSVFFTETYNIAKRMTVFEHSFSTKQAIAEADKILAGKLYLLGQKVKLDKHHDWHRDPITGIQWPKVFYAKVTADKSTQNCDIKYIWEINRHQFLIILGKAFLLTGEEKYAERIIDIICDWIDQNPYNCGVNWTSSLELAVRSISWLWALFFCKGSTSLTDEKLNKAACSLYQQAGYIEKHLSIYSSPYNHLIGEVAALHMLGSMLPTSTQTKKWKNTAWNILVKEVENQFHPDGFTVEQASFYHHFTLGFYLSSVFMRINNGEIIPPEVMNRLEKSLEFAMYLTRPDGELPQIGDIDSARSLYFYSEHSWDFRGFLGLGAVLFNRGDFKACSNGISEEMVWLCSDEMLERYTNLTDQLPKHTSVPFYKSGYFIIRDSWQSDSNYLCFDCGELAHGLFETDIPSAAHGHADALSLELSVYGKPVLVDGGFNTYFGDIAWHKHFRYEHAHNTLFFPESPQGKYRGRLKWSCVKKPHLKLWADGTNYSAVIGEVRHQNMTHQRSIFYINKHFYLLNDLLLSETSTVPEGLLNLNFSPFVKVENNKNELVADAEGCGLFIKCSGDMTFKSSYGGISPEQGWHADGYGLKSPATRVTASLNGLGSSSFFPILLLPWKDERELALIQESILVSDVEDGSTVVQFTLGTNQYCLTMNRGLLVSFKNNDKLTEITLKGRNNERL